MTFENVQTPMAPPSRRRSWRPWWVALGVVAVYLALHRPPASPEGWGDDYAAALTEAKKNHQRILLDFYMERCGPCRIMDREVLPREVVQKAMDGYVRVRLDVFQQSAIADRYRIVGTPTYAVIDENERLIAKVEGMYPVDAFVRFLKYARSASPAPMPSAEPMVPTAPNSASSNDSPTG